MTTPNTVKVGASLPAVIELTRERVDSRLMAQYLGAKTHQNTFELIRNHKADFDELGLLRFQTGKGTGGRPEKFVLLNEDHCYLLLTYSRNTAKVRALKVKLVKAFRDARRAAEVRQTEYLPNHHALHDAIKIKAAGSPNERFMHINANKALNQLAGVQAGQRVGANPLQQSLLAVGAAIAANAVLEAADGHGLQKRINAALAPLAGACIALEARHVASAPALR